MSLFQIGNFKLHSGRQSNWKIECDALTKNDWEALALMFMEIHKEDFYVAVGVPTGGIPFAKELNRYTYRHSNTVLVVDDVWTTGGSMTEFIKNELPDHNVSRGVAFARYPTPQNVTAIFTMLGSIA